MKLEFKLGVLIIGLIFLSGCASTIKTQELEAVKTVGVLNEFPDTPNFVTIGTTIFNNDYANIKDEQFSRTLTTTVVEYLRQKGFEAEVITSGQEDRFDMVIELIPRDVYATPGTYGYGVNQRSMFGNPAQANTYVALNLIPYISGKKKCSACYLQKLMPIDIEKLPATWAELSEEQRLHVTAILNQNIRESLTELLIETGI